MFNDCRVRITEYSEITREQAEERDPFTDKLMFCDGNIANHFFVIEFLEYAKYFTIPYHVAEKNIKVYDSRKKDITVKGIKLERFIFDAFVHSK